ncbi:hypothetical protein V6N11_021007 [Hibiscus sabdariffa]
MVWGTTSEVQKDNFICDMDVELQENDVMIFHTRSIPEIRFTDREKGGGHQKVTISGREIGFVQNEDAVNNAPMKIMPSNVSPNQVVTASTSLKSDKHVLIRVVEEGAKCFLKESNGRSSYGPIWNARSKTLNQNSTVNAGVVSIILLSYEYVPRFE